MALADPQTALDVEVDADLADFVPTFLENRRAEVAALREACARQDFPEIRCVGHRWKGVGGMYGFHWLTQVGIALELAAVDAPDAIAPLLDAAAFYLDNVRWRPVVV